MLAFNGLGQYPDLAERLRRCMLGFADRAEKAHTGDMLDAIGLDTQQLGENGGDFQFAPPQFADLLQSKAATHRGREVVMEVANDLLEGGGQQSVRTL